MKDTDVIDEPVEGMAFFINGKRGTCKDGWIKKILVNDNDMVMVYRANTHIELSTFDVSARVDKKGAYNERSDRKNNILPKEGDRVIIYSK